MRIAPLQRRWTMLVAVAAFGLAGTPAQTAETDWEPLFNGRDLSGWKVLNGTASYSAEEGAIVGTTVAGSPNSFLATEKTYRDFVLEFEARMEMDRTFNSGVQFRSASRPDYRNGRVHGYQCEIDPTPRGYTGGIYDEARRGWLYPVSLNPTALQPFKPDQWVRFRIEAIGPSLRTWVNDQLVSHVIDATTPEGFIALQVHSIDKPELAGRQVRWRNLRIQTRNLRPRAEPPIFVRNLIPNSVHASEGLQGWALLWNGTSSAGWRSNKQAGFPREGWEISQGVLAVAPPARGGDIVTALQYGDFEFQLEFQITEGANSGIKYFVQAGLPPAPGNVASVGLEFQILDDEKHPDAKLGHDGNRTVGSLYDLLPAAPDKPKVKPGEWHHARIVSRGLTVEHWLDGVRVLSYTRGSPAFRLAVAGSKFSRQPGFGDWSKGNILLQDHGDRVLYRSIKIRQ